MKSQHYFLSIQLLWDALKWKRGQTPKSVILQWLYLKIIISKAVDTFVLLGDKMVNFNLERTNIKLIKEIHNHNNGNNNFKRLVIYENFEIMECHSALRAFKFLSTRKKKIQNLSYFICYTNSNAILSNISTAFQNFINARDFSSIILNMREHRN